MFTRAERSALRARLVELAEADPQVVGAALVGSAARDAEDDLSDIDLVLQLAEDADEPSVVAGWTAEIERIAGAAVDTLDVRADGVRYRVFLLPSSLQVDVSFWPRDRFRAAGGPFRLLFGTPAEPTEPGRVDVDQVIGLGWLYALHARSAIARGRLWQAAGMLDELRGSLITLACERAGLESWHGRGVDRLPAADLVELHRSHPAGITALDLDRGRRSLTASFLREVGRHDADRAERLAAAFGELARPLPLRSTTA